MTEEVIMIDSDEAAKPFLMKGWLSRNGYFHSDEMLARYNGCTHRPCEQYNHPTPKGWVICQDCRDLKEAKKFALLPRTKWDGESMLYSETKDRFYGSPDEAEDDLEEDESLSDLWLVICKPNYPRILESDYFCDDLPEDKEIPPEIETAMDTFNNAISSIVLSWSPTKVALALEE